jgi:7-carboxy-7-deazaguanine synthase
MNNSLQITEQFFSIQGEGSQTGVPAVFVRLSACNLSCHFCDTKNLPTKNKIYTFEQILTKWYQNNWLAKLKQGAHLIITGGEPLLQKDNLISFIALLDKTLKIKPYIELETNSTIAFPTKLLARINQINASPKLANSGEALCKRYKPVVLTQLAQSKKVKFKFVVSSKQDVVEILNNYLKPFGIQHKNVWLMPLSSTREELQQVSAQVVDMCKQNLFNFSTRLQISIWNKRYGV